MIRLVRIATLACALAVAAPASAQFTFTQPGQQPQPVQQLQVWNNVARVNLGVGFYNSGYYNCFYWCWTVQLHRRAPTRATSPSWSARRSTSTWAG